MAFEIQIGKEEDLSLLLDMVKELAEFEKAPDQVINTEKAMRRDGFGPNKIFDFFMAYEGEQKVGMAITYFRYSTWKGRTLYLEDIYIREEFRSKGYGKKIFQYLGKFALQSGCNRMSWQVLDWNAEAIKFYQNIGSNFDNEWVNCSLEDEALNALAKSE